MRSKEGVQSFEERWSGEKEKWGREKIKDRCEG